MTFPRRPPDGAIHEADLSASVVLLDVSHLLPAHETKKWTLRDEGKIERVYVHHSGADGAEGYRGFAGSARYSARATARKSAWPGTPYTHWLPDLPDLMPDGRLVVYRGNADHFRTYHTGGRANRHGVAVAFQGNRRTFPPSEGQWLCWDALWPWLERRHELDRARDPFCPHSGSRPYGGSGKPSCPGPFIEARVKQVCAELALVPGVA